MQNRFVVGILVLVAGLVLLGWLLYDAGSVQATLGLGSVVSEATVAAAGLALVALSAWIGFRSTRTG